MRHLKSGRKLGVNPSHRKAMMRSMALALIERDQIQTTPARAKQLRTLSERLVTLAKRDKLHSRRRIVRLLGSTETKVIGQNRVRLALKKLYSDLVPRFKDRNGGYTQIVRGHRRPGDNAETCIMRYVPLDEKKAARQAAGRRGGEKVKSAKKKVEAPKDKAAPKKAPKKAAIDKAK